MATKKKILCQMCDKDITKEQYHNTYSFKCKLKNGKVIKKDFNHLCEKCANKIVKEDNKFVRKSLDDIVDFNSNLITTSTALEHFADKYLKPTKKKGGKK